MLATKHGIVLLQPAFSKYYIQMGEISTYPPGYKENAGIFCHTNPWIMIAEAKVGRGDKAYDYYLRINPSAREAISGRACVSSGASCSSRVSPAGACRSST